MCVTFKEAMVQVRRKQQSTLIILPWLSLPEQTLPHYLSCNLFNAAPQLIWWLSFLTALLSTECCCHQFLSSCLCSLRTAWRPGFIFWSILLMISTAQTVQTEKQHLEIPFSVLRSNFDNVKTITSTKTKYFIRNALPENKLISLAFCKFDMNHI